MSDSYVFFCNPRILIKTGEQCIVSKMKGIANINGVDFDAEAGRMDIRIDAPKNDWTIRDGLIYDIGKIILECMENNNE